MFEVLEEEFHDMRININTLNLAQSRNEIAILSLRDILKEVIKTIASEASPQARKILADFLAAI